MKKDEKLFEKFLKYTGANVDGDYSRINIALINGNDVTVNTDYDFYLFMNIDELNQKLYKLPSSVKDILENAKVKYYIVDNMEHEGDFKPEKNFIIYDNKSTGVNPYHEIGHAFDFNSGILSNTPEWLSIYESEKNNVKLFVHDMNLINHFKSNPQEFFAACFDYYFRDRDSLMESVPMAYEYINGFINEKKL